MNMLLLILQMAEVLFLARRLGVRAGLAVKGGEVVIRPTSQANNLVSTQEGGAVDREGGELPSAGEDGEAQGGDVRAGDEGVDVVTGAHPSCVGHSVGSRGKGEDSTPLLQRGVEAPAGPVPADLLAP